jgi:dual specificity protein kinase YAK1
VRDYLRQILEALASCERTGLIHCDLKPENILVAEDGVNVKLIDFGNATFSGHQVYTYIQSRYYRAPEVLMGCYRLNQGGQQEPLYDASIDMWSLGCTAVELFMKMPIFPGRYDYDQMLKILEFCGLPPFEYIRNSINESKFFLYNHFSRTYIFKTFQQYCAALP